MSLAGLSTLSTWSTLPGYQANLPEPFRASVWDKVLPPVRLLSEVVTSPLSSPGPSSAPSVSAYFQFDLPQPLDDLGASLGSVYGNLLRPVSPYPLASHMAPKNFLRGRSHPKLLSIGQIAVGTSVWFRRTIGYLRHPLCHSLAHCQRYLGLGLLWCADHLRPPDI